MSGEPKSNLMELIELLGQASAESGAVSLLYEAAKGSDGKFGPNTHLRRDFIALERVLGLGANEHRTLTASLGILSYESFVQAVKRAYLDGVVTSAHDGRNIEFGLLEFVEDMQRFGVTDQEIAGHIATSLEYRIVEGFAFDSLHECVTIPFVKAGSGKLVVKKKLNAIQKDPTAFRPNQEARKVSRWNAHYAPHIDSMYGKHLDTAGAILRVDDIYGIARINAAMDREFRPSDVAGWEAMSFDPFCKWWHPDRLSQEGNEGKYRALLEKRIALVKTIPGIEGPYDRAVQLAWLDILLSVPPQNTVGENAIYASELYRSMFAIAQAINAPREALEQMRAKSNERYHLDLGRLAKP
ncbi:MAG: hypothetical protein Q7S65_02920 [Nanoarchaeota archaeon]|nr:hypothetical protein [Nanoarchaeota archaeon]